MRLPRAGAASYTVRVSVCAVHSVCRKWFPGQSCHRGAFLYELSLVLPTTNAVFPFIIRKRVTKTRLISLRQKLMSDTGGAKHNRSTPLPWPAMSASPSPLLLLLFLIPTGCALQCPLLQHIPGDPTA